MIMWLKYFKENTEVGTENGGPKRRGLPSFYWFPGFSIALPLPLFSVCLCLFSLSLWWKNMEGSLSCDKAVACEMGKRDPSH